jgi:hypothetical protein
MSDEVDGVADVELTFRDLDRGHTGLAEVVGHFSDELLGHDKPPDVE